MYIKILLSKQIKDIQQNMITGQGVFKLKFTHMSHNLTLELKISGRRCLNQLLHFSNIAHVQNIIFVH